MINALRIRLKGWFETVRRPAAGLIAGGFLVTGHEAVSSQVWERIKASASIYAESFLLGSTQKGDRFTVEWIGLDTIVSYFNGRELAKVENQEFARALWSVWVRSLQRGRPGRPPGRIAGFRKHRHELNKKRRPETPGAATTNYKRN